MRFMQLLLQENIYNESDRRENDTDKPETHDDTFFLPADRLEMMMEWCDSEDLFPVSEFLARYLDDDRDDLEDVDTRDDDEDDESIRHHGKDGESSSERERSDISHIELRWFDIVPQEGDESADDEEADRREDEESFTIADIGVDCIIKKQESSGESIESVGDIYGICHRYHREDEKRDVEPSDDDRSDPRKLHAIIAELRVEPP